MTLVEEAQSLMLHQFANSKKLNGLIKALVKPFQEALDALETIHRGRYIDEAHGKTLDVIGEIVGQKRLGMSDEDFKPWIKVGILLNNNAATPDHILRILTVLFGRTPKLAMEEYPSSDVIFTFFEQPRFPIKVLFSIIRSAVPVAVRCQFIKAEEEQSEPGLLV